MGVDGNGSAEAFARSDRTDLSRGAADIMAWHFRRSAQQGAAIPTGGFTYLQFITPGIITQSVVFVAIFYGLYIIMDRDTGILQKLLVTPTPRLALVWGKMLSAGLRGLCQALIVFIFALILGIQLNIIVLVHHWGHYYCFTWCGRVYGNINDYCLYCKDARAIYGYRAGRHPSVILYLECDLSDCNYAGLVKVVANMIR